MPATSAPTASARQAALEARERLLSDLPLVERRVELAGISTTVLEAGEGQPLVLLHGPGEHAPKWLRVVPALAERHHLIAPDLPGHGESPVSDGPLDAGRALAWLAELIDRGCESPPVVVGQILGGAIAARFAADHSDCVAGLVLVDALGLVPFAPAPEFGQALMQFIASPDEQTHDGLWQHCAADLDKLRAAMSTKWEALKAYNLDRASAPDVQAAQHALMGAFAMEAVAPERLERITAPTALIWGRHDLATPLASARRISERYGWPLEIIDGAGDDPPIEQPEPFVRALHQIIDDRMT
jgi:pimeloyl-ACP methyl ester carboxylesterase